MSTAVAPPTPAAETAPAAGTEIAERVLIPLRARTTDEWPLASKPGSEYVIRVSMPQGPAPPGGFPVIYVLDGDAWFGAAVEVARIREYSKLSPAVIVGVAYPNRKFFDPVRRTFDFTPPGAVDADMESEGIKLGGAGQFLAFLERTFKPQLRARYPVSSEHEALFGHALGGLFVLYALFEAPESFETFLAASPSIFFADEIVLKRVPKFESNPARRSARVLVTAGEFETPKVSPEQLEDYRRYFTAHPELIDGQPVSEALEALFAPRENVRGRHTASEACALVERLARAGVRARFALFEGEEHTSAAVSALNRGVPFALRPESRATADVAMDAHGCEAARRLVAAPAT
jgi:predicted alpha/beta superfamily hydrolase